MRLLVLFIVIIGFGCEKQEPDPKRDLTNYKCSPEQLDSVERQYRICNESSFTSGYCYLFSVANNCDYIKDKIK